MYMCFYAEFDSSELREVKSESVTVGTTRPENSTHVTDNEINLFSSSFTDSLSSAIDLSIPKNLDLDSLKHSKLFSGLQRAAFISYSTYSFSNFCFFQIH